MGHHQRRRDRIKLELMHDLYLYDNALWCCVHRYWLFVFICAFWVIIIRPYTWADARFKSPSGAMMAESREEVRLHEERLVLARYISSYRSSCGHQVSVIVVPPPEEDKAEAERLNLLHLPKPRRPGKWASKRVCVWPRRIGAWLVPLSARRSSPFRKEVKSAFSDTGAARSRRRFVIVSEPPDLMDKNNVAAQEVSSAIIIVLCLCKFNNYNKISIDYYNYYNCYLLLLLSPLSLVRIYTSLVAAWMDNKVIVICHQRRESPSFPQMM